MTLSHFSLSDRQLLPESQRNSDETQELSGVLEKIVQNAGALLDVQSCSLALADITGSVLVTQAALRKDGQQPRRTRFQLNEGAAGWVAEHRAPLLINDTGSDVRFKRLGRMPVGSIICVPLMDDERVLGTLTASSPATDAFSERQLQMLLIFADQAAQAITNARHAELARRQANQLETLLDLSQGITTRLDAPALYRAILTNVRRLMPSVLALIYTYDAAAHELVPVAEMGRDTSVTHAADAPAVECEQEGCEMVVTTEHIERERIGLNNEDSAAAWAAGHRHPILRAGSSTIDHGGSQAETITEGQEVRVPEMAEMAAPLVSKNSLYGVISLRRAEPFTSEELRLLRNLSTMAAAALENVTLFHRVHSEQQQLRTIVTASSDGIALLGITGCFLEANPAFGQIFGMEPERIAGMECLELFSCEQEDGHDACEDLCMILKALQMETSLPYREIELTINGASRCIGLSITPIATAGQPLCLMMARDVTAIRDATRMKANFLSMITHELRSPLNAINGYLDLALTGVAGELNEQQREFMQRARASSEHLYALVEDLLLISRADSGQVRLSRAVTNLQEIVANAVEELELMAGDAQVQVQLDIPRDFPPIYADPMRLQQVLRNLVSNALRFTSAGGRVTIAARVQNTSPLESDDRDAPRTKDEETRWLELRVQDTGQGIAPEHVERIFERFYQAPPRVSGQGLGLAIVKMVVELHGGLVSVESVPGQGSAFTCLLPCVLS